MSLIDIFLVRLLIWLIVFFICFIFVVWAYANAELSRKIKPKQPTPEKQQKIEVYLEFKGRGNDNE